MFVSLNEIAATAAKAVRGCGHPEGIAEEIGLAVRWLCERELPGLAVVLSALDDRSASEDPGAPVLERRGSAIRLRSADGGRLSALRVAPSIVELVVAGAAGPDGSSGSHSVGLDALTHPLLLAPFVARSTAAAMAARWETPDGPVVVGLSGAGVRIRAGTESALVAAVGRQVIVEPSEPDHGPPIIIISDDLDDASRRSITGGCPVDDTDWERLCELAARTYVPVSEESRLRGAGAGLTDND